MFDLAGRHSVAGIVYYQCNETMPEALRKKYLNRYLGEAVASIRREALVKELAGRFEEVSLSAVFMKGAVYRDYYPLPPLRSMGDIDIVIRKADKDAVDRILRDGMGFDRFIENHSVWTYWKDNLYLEVHNRMFYEELANKVDYCSYFDEIWAHVREAQVFAASSPAICVPEENFHFLYLMAHTAKHVLNNGSGFRAYLDMIFMTQALADVLDWAYLQAELEKLGLLTFTKTCFSCCEKWFGVNMPLRLETLDEGLLERITEKTFRDGAFGLENVENKPAAAARDIRRSDSPYFFAAVKRGIKKLFPPYRDLQLVPWYSFIDGKPWLLPFVWVYRFFYCGIRKLRHSVKLLAEPFTKKKEVVERQALMREWGL